MIFDVLKTLFSPVWSAVTGRRRVSVRVHQAAFIQSNVEAYFINIVNLSEKRDIEITHIWFDASPQIPVWQSNRPLPKRLKPDEVWETWIETWRIPQDASNPFKGFRVRLSTGKVLKSSQNRNVPPIGVVPGNHNE
jgi:hypothetical protein